MPSQRKKGRAVTRSDRHEHTPARYGRTFAIGVTLNVGFVIIEAFYGWHTQSLDIAGRCRP